MKKITPLSLFMINQVRLKRLILGVSARYLSIYLEHTEAYVSNVEGSNNENQYPPHEWPKLAEALRCSVHDLLPPGQSESTGGLVDKVVISLASVEDLLLILEGMVSIGFFAELKALVEVEKYLFLEKAEQREALGKALGLLVESGKLNSVDGRFVVGSVG